MIRDTTPRPMLVSPAPAQFFAPPSQPLQQYAFQQPYASSSYIRPEPPQYPSPVEYHRPATSSSLRTQSQPPPDRLTGPTPNDPYFSLPSSPASSSPFSTSPDVSSPESTQYLPTPVQTLAHPIPAAPSYPSSPSYSYRSPFSSPFMKTPASLKRSTTLPQKKPTRSTLEKRSAVQLSLELKVEKAKGFIVIPLGRAPPPAPPSSPVLGPVQPGESWGNARSAPIGINSKASADYFGGWESKLDEQDEWVEQTNDMEVDLR